MSKGIEIVIVEDEIIIAKDIRQALENVGYKVLGVARDYDNAIKILDLEKPDLLLLDITLKGNKNGIDVARYVQGHFRLPYIYITSHANKETLNAAIETKPNGYLVKPFNEDDLFTSIELALFNFNSQSSNIDSTIEKDKNPFSDSLFVKNGKLFQRIKYEDLYYLEADSVYTHIKTSNKQLIERQSLSDFEKQLDPNTFIRVHRSYIINTNHLTGLQQDRVLLDGIDKPIPLGRTYKEKLLKLIES